MQHTDNLQNPETEIIGPDFTSSDDDAKALLTLQKEKQQSLQKGKALSFFTLADVPEVFSSHWLVKGIIPFTGIGIIYGEYSSGKTFLVIELALAIAGGKDFFRRKVKQRPVLYFCLEGEEGFMNRLAAWKKTHDEWPTNIQFNSSDFDFFDLSEEEIGKFPKNCVIIIDTLNATDPTLDENTSAGMGKIIARAKEFQKITGGLILFIHHAGKDVTKGARGHSSLMAAADIGILVTSNGTRSWKVVKNKDGKADISGKFILQEISLGVDEDGEPITSCVVHPCEAPEVPEDKLSLKTKEAFNALKHALAEAGTDEISFQKWREKWEAEYPIKRNKSNVTDQQKNESNRVIFNRYRNNLVTNKYIAEDQGMVRLLRSS